MFFRPLYIYLCRLLRVFVAVLRRSLVAARWLLVVMAPLIAEHQHKGLWARSCNLRALQCGLRSCGAGACGIFQDQGSNR